MRPPSSRTRRSSRFVGLLSLAGTRIDEPNVLEIWGRCVLGGCTFNLSARKSWRIHLTSVKARVVGYPGQTVSPGGWNHGRIVVSAAVKHRNALFGSWARPLLSSTPALLQNLHLAQVRQRAKCRGPE